MNTEKLSQGLMTFATKIQQNKYISAISNGLLSTLPLMMVGAIGSIINSLGIPALQDFLVSSGLKTIVSLPAEVGNNMVALFASFAIAYRYAQSDKKDALTAGVLSLMAFLFITPLQYSETGSVTGIPSQWLGSAGLFVAMIVGILTSKLFCTFIDKKITIKLPDSVPPVISRTFASILPALAIAFCSLVLAFLFTKTGFGSVHGFVYAVLSKPLSALGGSFPALLVAVLAVHLFWAVGVHGTMVALSIFMPLWAPLDAANLAAFNAGQPAASIVCMQFFFLSGFIGGAGNTLALILNMMTSKVESNKTLAKLAIVPGLFGINEPIIFGMPIVLNPLMLIPFIVSPTLCTILGYIMVKIGLLAAPTGISSISGMPVVVSQILQGGWTWGLWVIICLVISYFIYRPFFKMYEKKQLEEMPDDQQAKVDSISAEFAKATR